MDKHKVTHQWAEHAAAPNTHNRTMELLVEYMGSFAGKKICDLPCGAGAFSAQVAAQGADVTAVDLVAVEPFFFDKSRQVLTDANNILPFADEEFDAMVSIEGIEHLESPTSFLRECTRVIKPGGLLLLTTPNVDSYRSRRSVYFQGFHRNFKPLSSEHRDSWHLHPIDMIFMRGAAKKVGLEFVGVAVNSMRGKNCIRELFRPLFTRRLPTELRGIVPYYGDVIIYVLKKSAVH